MTDPTIRAVQYCLPIKVGEGKHRRAVTWAAWSTTRPGNDGYGMTKEDAIDEVERNMRREQGETDAE